MEGFIYGMDMKEYHLAKGLNASSLKNIVRDPFMYFNKVDFKTTPSMVEGTLLHTLFLEPHLFEKQFVIDNKVKAGKEAKFNEDGKNIINTDLYEITLECVEYVKKKLVELVGINLDLMDSEVSFFGKFRGRDAKCRADKLTKDKKAVFDIKKTRDASTKDFIRQACDLDYCIQEVFYTEMMGLDAFHWLAIETKPVVVDGKNHFRFNIFKTSDEFKEKGKSLIENALRILDNKEAFNSPLYTSEFIKDDLDFGRQIVKEIKPPLWYLKD